MRASEIALEDRVSFASQKHHSQFRIFLRMFGRNRGAVVGTVLLAILLLIALLAPWIVPYDPFQQDVTRVLGSPDRTHWLGNDHLGRDLFSRILVGSRLSITTGLVAVAIGTGAGVVLGLLSGFYGRYIDSFVMRTMDVLLAFPGILLAMAIVAFLGTNLTNLMIAIGVSAIPTFTRVIRASVLAAKETPYTLSARAAGCTDVRIMFIHILPNVVAPVIVLATLQTAGAILAASGLSYIGLGAQPPTAEWGAMLSGGRNYMREAWWLTTFPGLAIMITILTINLMGDGLRDAFDPRLRR